MKRRWWHPRNWRAAWRHYRDFRVAGRRTAIEVVRLPYLLPGEPDELPF